MMSNATTRSSDWPPKLRAVLSHLLGHLVTVTAVDKDVPLTGLLSPTTLHSSGIIKDSHNNMQNGLYVYIDLGIEGAYKATVEEGDRLHHQAIRIPFSRIKSLQAVIARDAPQSVNLGAFRTDHQTRHQSSSPVGGGSDRDLQPWKAPNASSTTTISTSTSSPFGPGDVVDLTLGCPEDVKRWNQFDVNRRLFGVQVHFDEHQYTTRIDTASPQYRERVQTAERIAQEIERGAKRSSAYHDAEVRGDELAVGKGVVNEEVDEELLYSSVQTAQPPGPFPQHKAEQSQEAQSSRAEGSVAKKDQKPKPKWNVDAAEFVPQSAAPPHYASAVAGRPPRRSFNTAAHNSHASNAYFYEPNAYYTPNYYGAYYNPYYGGYNDYYCSGAGDYASYEGYGYYHGYAQHPKMDASESASSYDAGYYYQPSTSPVAKDAAERGEEAKTK